MFILSDLSVVRNSKNSLCTVDMNTIAFAKSRTLTFFPLQDMHTEQKGRPCHEKNRDCGSLIYSDGKFAYSGHSLSAPFSGWGSGHIVGCGMLHQWTIL